MRGRDKIAEITSDTDDKKISMSLSDMQELITTVLKKERKRGKRRKKAEEDEELENYLLPSDIANIIDEFSELEHNIKAEESETPDTFIDLMCGLVENAIYTRVRDLSRQRKIEKITEFASAQARDEAETPRYYRPWRRLFRLTPNTAMELINANAEQTARLKHMQQQVENDKLKALADDWDEKYKSGQPINFKEDDGEEYEEEPAEEGEEPEEVEEAEESDGDEEPQEPEEVAPTLPERKRRAKPSEREPSKEDDGQITIDEAIETQSEDEEDENGEAFEEEPAEEPEEVEEAEELEEDDGEE